MDAVTESLWSYRIECDVYKLGIGGLGRDAPCIQKLVAF